MAIDAILAEVKRYDCRYITVTGGEPLAQPACLALLTQLVELGYQVSLETSGALDISGVDPRVVIVMDLKTPGSGEADKNRYQNLACLAAKDQLKFVIGNEEDYQWSKVMLAEHQLLERCQVLFSPVMGQQNPTELAEWILRDRLPVRFQVQLHKLLWGDTPGK